MAFDFRETLTLHIPDVEEQFSGFKESILKRERGIVAEVAAIHEGLTQNFTYYGAAELTEALPSWVNPYPKPIIMNHDLTSEPMGRVMAAKMETEEDGTPYTMLQIAVTDPKAVEKVLDQRYLTGSVGGKAGAAFCSVCSADWANASITSLPCEHRRGKTYKGKLAFLKMSKISFKEYSIVNAPADSLSGIRSVKVSESGEIGPEEDGWLTNTKIFSINMNEEEVLEFSESATGSNLLEGKAKKDVSPVYMQIKGAFLSALATAEALDEEVYKKLNDSKQENEVITDERFEEEEDILDVTQELSEDLQKLQSDASDLEEEADEDTPVEEDASEDEIVSEDEEESTEASVEEGEEEVSEEEIDDSADETSVEEGESETSDAVAEDDGEEPVAEADVEEEAEEPVNEEEVAEDEEDSETELNESEDDVDQALESRVEELQERCNVLEEQNTKLRTLLKANLAERVVDMKIALGISESDERSDLIADHAKRSASSLADTLRDLAKMPRSDRPTDFSGVPSVEELSTTKDEGEPVIDGDESDTNENKKADPANALIDRMVDGLMGRRPL